MNPVAWRRCDTPRTIVTENEDIAHGWALDHLLFEPLYAIPEGFKIVPIEVTTDELADAPRGFIQGLDMGCRTYEKMRDFMRQAGYDYSSFPEWAKTAKGHINKASIAIIIYTMMLSAAPEAP